jgi:thiol:disulfide interchange protein DsbD
MAVPKIETAMSPSTARRGQTASWQLTVELAPGWHTYPTHQSDPKAEDYVSTIQITLPEGVVFAGDLEEPQPLSKSEPDLEIRDLRYYEGKTVWRRRLLVLPSATPGKKEIKASARLTVCDIHSCLPPKTVSLTAPFTVSDADAVPVDPTLQKFITEAPAPPPTVSPPANEQQKNPDELAPGPESPDYHTQLQTILTQLQPEETPHGGLASFLLAGVFWGAVSLVTPCVFPMIPITVSIFLKQSEKEHRRALSMALVYSLTIVCVLTIAAVLLLSFFRSLSVSPSMNYGLGILFIFFALSLFGMYDIELPSGLARLTSAKEGQGGLVGIIFMALTFTIISFACVAPFLGGFGGTAATAHLTMLDRVLGGLAFSATFAAPFFVLALFPSLLKKLPKSGSWLNSVKVIMGFLEMAAALKFLRAGELMLFPHAVFFTYDLVLGMWIALSVLAGLYLLNVYRLPHDTPSEHISVPRLILGFLFVSLGFYLAPALFNYSADGEKQRPGGAIYSWVDSFLLPEPREGKSRLEWTGNLKRAIDEARSYRQSTGQRKLVFIDFTGETCTNCKLNEHTVFSRPEIIELFLPYKLVQLYTDKVPDKYYSMAERDTFGSSTAHQRSDASTNLWFQREAFGTEQLPLYVILEPLPGGKIEIAAKYAEGKINDETAFAEFLRKPLLQEGARAEVAARR